MRKLIAIILLFACPIELIGREKDGFVFEVDWGSVELGRNLDQDVIVFHIDDFRIIRPTERDSKKIIYQRINGKEMCRWALIENIGNHVGFSISCYGTIPEADGSVLNVRDLISTRVTLKVMNCPMKDEGIGLCALQFYKIDSDRLDPIFYARESSLASFATCKSFFGAGRYLLAVRKFYEPKPYILREFSVTKDQILKINKEFLSDPSKNADDDFCGELQLDFSKLAAAESKWVRELELRIPRTSNLAAALVCYYRNQNPSNDFSTEFKEDLNYLSPYEK